MGNESYATLQDNYYHIMFNGITHFLNQKPYRLEFQIPSQTRFAINPGNSGGDSLNLERKFIG
ncbi:MAG TPA: hypothetical protein VJ767_06210 [Nitrososphaeraceae archaeon]|nr:hypothetical protein [Nitrososphaeraceae archaeon]